MSAEGPQGLDLCVYCRRLPVMHDWRPFCSERCKLLDLARWADESYIIAGKSVPDPDERANDPEES
jgi:endogenous inhibitor of DNA gyrase (YacG/DUF329 family)